MTTASTGSRPRGTADRPLTADEKESRLAEVLAAEYVRSDWGLGVPGSQGTGTHHEELGITDEATALAAVAVVLSHYDRLDRVVLGTGEVGPDASRGVALAALPVSDRTRVADLLEGAADRLARPWPWYEQEVAAMLARADGGGEVSVAVRSERDAVPGRGRPAPEYRAASLPFPLALTVSRADSGLLSSTWSFRRERFHPGMVAQFARHVAFVGRQLTAAGPGAELSSIELLDQEERKRVAALGDPGRTVPDEPRRIDELVAARAAAHPEAVAVSHGREQLTYRQLDESAGRLACALRALGVRSGSRVGVCMDRSPELVATLLAVLRAGAAYVPMEPGHPAERLGYTTEDAGVVLVVTDSKEFPDGPAMVIRPEELRVAADRCPASTTPAGGSADDPAYVIYTSGTTGRPKGVAVTHRNVTALISGTDQDFRFSPSDVWALFHSVAFDMSVWEIWGALTTGGRLAVLPHIVCRSPRELHALLTAERVSVLNQTPSAFAQLLEAERTEPGPLALRLVTFGGEPLDTRMLLPWFDRHPEAECQMVNLYGITETTVHSTWTTVTHGTAAAASREVGTALPGEYLSVRDSAGRLLPPGVAGEIHVGGAGVALGYLNRPELTAERFLPDPDRGGRMYRSGDKGRLLPHGALEHLGRLDSQVKLRGYRVEPDEIRAVLLEDPRVLAAAVVVSRSDPDDPATARLDAYAVLDGVGPAADGESGAAIRDRARRMLPDYMVPSTVTVLPALPLTANGKLDRSRLPRPLPEPEGPDAAPEASEGRRPCAASPEGTVRKVWMSIVGVPAGLDDNFFDVGGNSILIGRMVRELEQLGLPRLSLRQVYLHPTIRRLSGLLEQLSGLGEK